MKRVWNKNQDSLSNFFEITLQVRSNLAWNDAILEPKLPKSYYHHQETFIKHLGVQEISLYLIRTL